MTKLVGGAKKKSVGAHVFPKFCELATGNTDLRTAMDCHGEFRDMVLRKRQNIQDSSKLKTKARCLRHSVEPDEPELSIERQD